MSDEVVVRVLGTTMEGMFPLDEPARYLVAFDVDAHDGLGAAEYGPVESAHRFPSAADALAAWRAVPACRPVRWDGRPNRPLTALTVEVIRVDAL